jgi:MFS transporter, UMF1 family
MNRNAVLPIVRNDPKIVRGWVMYDWANSVYQLTIASTIFPIYFNAVTHSGNSYTVSFFGYEIVNTVLYSWSIAFAYLFVAILSPLLSSFADYTGRRRAFMKTFTIIGAVSCGLLFFFDKNTIELGTIAFTLATIGYGGSIVFYNSFLPVIASEDMQDRISARGYSLGYLGGVVLLLFNLLMIMQPGLFGIAPNTTLPAQISFVTVFVWWLGFSQITFEVLPKYTLRKRNRRERVLLNGYRELRQVFKKVVKSYQLSVFLIGFFFTMMGLLTTMFMAASYGEKQLGVKEDVLIGTILVIQLVGIAGAWSFARLSERVGNMQALLVSLVIWIAVCIYAFAIKGAGGFIVAAIVIGLVMGGTQSLARSTYSKMLPETTDHTSYFSFYDVLEKMATVLGTFMFGIIEVVTGSMRYSVLSIAVFFVLGLVSFLLLVGRGKPKKRAPGSKLLPC